MLGFNSGIVEFHTFNVKLLQWQHSTQTILFWDQCHIYVIFLQFYYTIKDDQHSIWNNMLDCHEPSETGAVRNINQRFLSIVYKCYWKSGTVCFLFHTFHHFHWEFPFKISHYTPLKGLKTPPLTTEIFWGESNALKATNQSRINQPLRTVSNLRH